MQDYLRSGWVNTGLALLIVGAGPLLFIIVAAAVGLWPDPNPNPVGPGLLFALTFWPAIICIVVGLIRVRIAVGVRFRWFSLKGIAMKLTAALCVLVTIAPNIAACDELFRCGKWLVSSELSVAELLQKCGEPSSRQASTEDVRAHVARGGTEKLGTTTTEVWRYDRGSTGPAMLVTIVDGKIQSIERDK